MPVEDLLAKLFIARPDVKAIQRADGAYNPMDTGFDRSDLLDHLAGRRSYGHYLLNTNDQCKLFAFDIDLVGMKPDPEDPKVKVPAGRWMDPNTGDVLHVNCREVWAQRDTHEPDGAAAAMCVDFTVQLRCMAEALAMRTHALLGVQVAITYSGNKGLHVYGFADGPQPAEDVREAAIVVLDDIGLFEPIRGKNFYRHRPFGEVGGYPNLEIEVFPKQTSIKGADGYGNLLRLPLGVNMKSRKPGFFVDVQVGYDTLRPMNPEAALTQRTPWGDTVG